jgi:hypothetical protein
MHPRQFGIAGVAALDLDLGIVDISMIPALADLELL